MKTTSSGTTLTVSGLEELGAANAGAVRERVRSALEPQHTSLDVDLSSTRFIDSSGLGALVGLHKTLCQRNGQMRLVHPTPAVRQILELTRLHLILEIVNA